MLVLGVEDGFNYNMAKELGVEVHPMKYKFFTDGEPHIRILGDTKKVRRQDFVVFSVRGTAPSFQSQQVYEVVRQLSKKLARDYKVKAFGVVPYMSYARQDRKFQHGEVTTLLDAREELMDDLTCMINVTLHDYRKEGWRSEKNDFEGCGDTIAEAETWCRERFGRTLGEFLAIKERVFDNIYNIDATPEIGKYLATNGFDARKGQRKPVLVISPDLSASGSTKIIAEAIGGKTLDVEKYRDLETGQITRPKGDLLLPEDVEGVDIIINDDMYATGSTAASVAEDARKKGARYILCVGTHAVLSEKEGVPCLKRLHDAKVDDMITANSIISFPISKVKLGSIIGKKLKDTVLPKYGIKL